MGARSILFLDDDHDEDPLNTRPGPGSRPRQSKWKVLRILLVLVFLLLAVIVSQLEMRRGRLAM